MSLDLTTLDLTAEELSTLGSLLAGKTDEEILEVLQGVATDSPYRSQPVDVETFLLHPDYLGLKDDLYPKLVTDLIEMLSGEYDESLLFGSLGWGKSWSVAAAMCRALYELSCLRDPARFHGIASGSNIVLLTMSANITQSKKVLFSDISKMIERSPYFREQFPKDDDVKNELRFPNHISLFPASASEEGAIGHNLWGGVIDEANFLDFIEKSALNRGGEYDQARVVYTLLKERVASRFNNQGRIPGMIHVVSSARYPDSFTEQRAREIVEKGEKRVFVRRYATWETKPAAKISPKRFFLYLGTSGDRPAIAEAREDFAGKDSALVLAVPEDYRQNFTTDIDRAIRAIAGRPTMSISPFLPQREKLFDAIERGRQLKMAHPFTKDVTTLRDGTLFIPGMVKFDPSLSYYAHVDLAIRHDCAGLAVGHIHEWREVTRTRKMDDGEDVTIKVTLPVVIIDVMLRIQAPKDGEIQVDDVRALLLEFREHGCNLRKITYDQFESSSSLQAFRNLGIDAETFSVDRPIDAYNALKETILEDRLIAYPYEPFVEEMVALERVPTASGRGEKVDHPPRGGKDVTDACAGIVAHCVAADMGVASTVSRGSTSSESPFAALTSEARSKLTVADIIFGAYDRDHPEPDEEDYASGFA